MPFFFSLIFLCFFIATSSFFSSSLHIDFFLSFFALIFFFFNSFFLMGCYSLFWAFLALIFGLDYYHFFLGGRVFSGFVMFLLLNRLMTWDQSFKYQHQTLKTEIFWLHFLGLFYEIKVFFFSSFSFSLCILLLSLGCSLWVLFKEMKMWSGRGCIFLNINFCGSHNFT